ncbi:lipopolysaccharide kinase InaA family protein [Christiangramia forsetii]|uniref:Kdo domain containing protein n=2 Tax=Christiangramia forsetii TaxID=411153 RepID=A0M3P8_CHRFK|nr:lipopolysaccharide kinase InaA family protein [Christiangramia forsetii]GGG25287.1 hypothetical protein GCM10011532_05810 [Christiangramia forsetii]CAL67243.1 conserved hypothetical protein [Christiangramia forsetii KT0803]
MRIIISSKYEFEKAEITRLINNFNAEGEILFKSRNKIKLFEVGGRTINIKSFKVPNAVNKIAYKFFRKSKAERSFTYAQILEKKGVGTPLPIGYAEETRSFSFGKSFYISEQINAELTFRELVTNPKYPDHENILRAFTRFTFELHEKEIQFLDHSPGNTLIQKHGDVYSFFLVDLNRMNFKKLTFDERMLNFSRLTPQKEMVAVMASEYSQLIDKNESEVFEKMWFYTRQFQEKFKRKKELKKKLKFWKKG